jgi:eukaryotic-like serine/threonine-protein kinase
MKDRIGHYEILGKLGEGGMGVVYKARDLRLDRIVALKMLPEDRLDRTQRDRLVREARTASALNHPNIVTIYEIDSSDDMQLIAMEYVPGKSLAELIQPGGLPLQEVLKYAAQIAEAVGKAHAEGIVHRDLKPPNIMVTGEGIIKILDFGLAKKYIEPDTTGFASTLGAELTRPGMILGTVAYMSPEQALGESADARSDIFSLGVILYELLAGARPFVGNTTLATLQKIQVETPKPLASMRSDLPASVERIIEKALEKDPKNRHQTMQELRTELLDAARKIQQRENSGNSLVREASTLVFRSGRFFGRHRWTAALSCITVLFVLEFSSVERWLSEVHISRGPAPLREPAGVLASAMSASEWSDQAQAWLQRYDVPGNTDRAIEASKKALERDSAHAMAYAILAQAYDRKNSASPDPQWARLAAESARQAVDLNPDMAAAHLARGIVLLAAHQIDEAGTELRRAQELDPLNAAVVIWQGEYYSQKKNLKDAEDAYRRAGKLDPRNWTAFLFAGTFFYKNARYAEAITAYEQARALTPDNVLVLRDLAAAYHSQDRDEEAASALQRALEIQPTAPIYNNLGTWRFYQGRYTDSAAAFDKAVQLNPTRYLYWGNFGDALRWVPGSESKAKDAYSHAITLVEQQLKATPDNPELRSSLAIYYARSGDRQHALEVLDQLEKLSNRTAGSYFKALLAYEIAGNRTKALQALQAALRFHYPLSEIKNEPDLTSLRADRRYYDIIAANPG